MREAKLQITNRTGLHARPASQLVQLAKQYQSSIQVAKGGTQANCKSIVKVLACNVMQGDEVTLRAEGPDEDAAVEALVALIGGLEE